VVASVAWPQWLCNGRPHCRHRLRGWQQC